MMNLRPRRFAWVLMLTLGWWAAAAQADEFRYHYISLNKVPLPAGFILFEPTTIDDAGRVYGMALDAAYAHHVAIYADGAVTVLHPGFPLAANARGTIGGFVTDPQTGKWQAALFRGTTVEPIPFLPGEDQSSVVSLDDSDTALLWSIDSSGSYLYTLRLYSHGESTFVYKSNAGGDWRVNNQGIVMGTIYDTTRDAFRVLRLRPPYDEPLTLEPLPGDHDTESFDINSAGSILGISTVEFADPMKISYGIWDRAGNFKTYLVTTGFRALFNDQSLIVLTENYQTDSHSYLVPRPGVRLNLEDLLDNPAAMESPFQVVRDINNRGDMIGYGVCSTICPTFLLRRSLAER